jgi:DNA-binding transcriptional MerR regulator
MSYSTKEVTEKLKLSMHTLRYMKKKDYSFQSNATKTERVNTAIWI